MNTLEPTKILSQADIVTFFQAFAWEKEWVQTSEKPIVDWQSGFYPNLEQWVKIQPPSTGDKALVVARFTDQEPLAQQLQRLSLLLQALARYTEHLSLFMPYMPYCLQDRETSPGLAVASQLLVKQIEATGIDEVVLVDVHSPHNLEAWQIPIKHLTPTSVLAQKIKEICPLEELTIVAPDHGAQQRALQLADALQRPLVTLQKRRLGPGKVVIAPLEGDQLKTNHLLIVDDILNTGGTLITAIEQLKLADQEVKVSVAVTHGLFANGAEGKLQRVGVEELFVTDSFAASIDTGVDNLHQVSIFPSLLS